MGNNYSNLKSKQEAIFLGLSAMQEIMAWMIENKGIDKTSLDFLSRKGDKISVVALCLKLDERGYEIFRDDSNAQGE